MSDATTDGDTESVWEIRAGAPRTKRLPVAPIGAVENLDYNNPTATPSSGSGSTDMSSSRPSRASSTSIPSG